MIWGLTYIHIAIYNTDNKDLLNGAGNRTQYLVVNRSGKNLRIHSCIYTHLSVYLPESITL